jgi:hypothetical protein
MATWIIIIGVAMAVATLGGALLIVVVSTREPSGRARRLPGLGRFASPASGSGPPDDTDPDDPRG